MVAVDPEGICSVVCSRDWVVNDEVRVSFVFYGPLELDTNKGQEMHESLLNFLTGFRSTSEGGTRDFPNQPDAVFLNIGAWPMGWGPQKYLQVHRGDLSYYRKCLNDTMALLTKHYDGLLYWLGQVGADILFPS